MLKNSLNRQNISGSDNAFCKSLKEKTVQRKVKEKKNF